MGNAETRLTDRMRKDGAALYGSRLVLIKYHGNAYSQSGVSDLLGCLDGTFFACEVKAPESYPVKGKPSVEKALEAGPTVLQRAFIGHVQDAGGYGWVAATREQFLEGLAAIDALNRFWCYQCTDLSNDLSCERHPLTGMTTL